jgi:hypothetical protein
MLNKSIIVASACGCPDSLRIFPKKSGKIIQTIQVVGNVKSSHLSDLESF